MSFIQYNHEGKLWLVETFRLILGFPMYVCSVIGMLFGLPLFIAYPYVLYYVLAGMITPVLLILVFFAVDSYRGIYDPNNLPR